MNYKYFVPLKVITFIFLIHSYNFLFAQDLTKAFKHYQAEEYGLAADEFEKIIPELEYQLGDKDTSKLVKIIFYAAMSFDYDKNYKKAKHYYASCIDIYKQVNYKTHTIYIQSCIYLGNIFYQEALTAKSLEDRNNSFKKAEDLYLVVEKLYINYYGKNNQYYLQNCNNLAWLYDEIGDYKNALAYYKETKDVITKLVGKQNQEYATSLNNLAVFLLKIGQYKDVEYLYSEVRKLYENYYGKNSISYALSLNNLAGYYTIMGNYKKAEPLYNESYEIYKKNKNLNPKEYIQSCKNLAIFRQRIGKTDGIEELLKESKERNTVLYGKNTIEYAKSCSDLGLYYFKKGSYLKGINLIGESKTIIEKTIGKQTPEYAHCIHISAQIHDILGNAEKAEPYFIESVNITEQILGNMSYSYTERCCNSGAFYERNDKYDDAEKYYLKANKVLNEQIQRSSLFLSEQEKAEFMLQRIQDFYFVYNSFYLIRQKEKKQLVGMVYNNALNFKGQLLSSSTALRNLIINSGDEELIKLFNKLNNIKETIAKQYTIPISERYNDLSEREEEANVLEKELIRRTNDLLGYEEKIQQNKTWELIKNKLKDDEAAVEFVSFDYHNKYEWTDSTLYFALILRKDFTYPEPVFLFEQKQLETLLKRDPNISEYQYIKELYDPASSKAKELYKLIWSPLSKHLNETKNIYLSPVGLLNRISFDALPLNHEKILSDRYKLIYMGSTSDIIGYKELLPNEIDKAVLFGGIDYTIEPEELIESVNKSKIKRSEYIEDLYLDEFDKIRGGISWDYLPSSLEEINEIQATLKNNNISAVIFSKKEALEEEFKNMQIDVPSILHIATHGFYFGNDEKAKLNKQLIDQDIEYAHSEQPLVRSGFILSGGNTAFQGGDIPDGIEDGVLTAMEISNLNLYKTKLVVLSACQTGLGDVKGNEGVYGLQRAFKMAGVDYLIFSLWEVPDETTKELMTKFYEFWFSGLEIREAFKKAQEHLKEKYKGIPGSVYAWAAFILMN